MNLSLLIAVPVLASVAILLCRNGKQVRAVALLGAAVQMLLALWLLSSYHTERAGGNMEQMLFQFRTMWFAPLNIQYFVGVDGISVAMVLLTASVVLAGILVSWNVEKLTKEFFFLLM